MSREGRLVKHTVILAIGTFFPKLTTFLALPVLTAFLTKTEYGTYDLVVTLVSLMLPVATMQIQSAAFRFLIGKQDDNQRAKAIITNIYAFIAAVSTIVLIIGFLLMGSLPLWIRLSICLYYFFDIVSNVSRQVIRGLGRNMDYTVSAIISGVGQIAFICLLVMGLHKGLLGGLVALGASEMLSAIYLLYRGKLYRYIAPRFLSKEVIKELLGYSWPLIPNSIAQWVIHASDRLIISWFMGAAANAVYAVAYKIPSILSLVQTTFNMAWQENASETAEDTDAAAYYSSMFEWLFNITAGMMAVLIGITPILFAIFVRGDYAEAYNHMPILSLGMFFLCLSTFWGGIFVAIKKTKTAGTTTVIAAVVNLVVNISTIRWIGLYAASVSSLVAYIIMCLSRALSVQKFMKIRYNVRHIVIVVGMLMAQCFLCFLQNGLLNIVNIVLGLAICFVLNHKLIRAIFRKKVGMRLKHTGGEKGTAQLSDLPSQDDSNVPG